MLQHKELQRENSIVTKENYVATKNGRAIRQVKISWSQKKISMLQQIVQLATKIKEGNMSGHFQSFSQHKVQIQHCKATRLCHDIEILYCDNNNMQL